MPGPHRPLVRTPYVLLPPLPEHRDRAGIEAWVAAALGDLTLEGPDGVRGSGRFVGGQEAADGALAMLDLRGYAAERNEVWPPERRGASQVSPYVRYGLLGLPRLWAFAADAPARDRDKYRDELLWQEYARHLYARLGPRMARPLRYEAARAPAPWQRPWPHEMACVQQNVDELERDGWLVNQTRMWLSSQFTVRGGHPWRDGEDRFFTHLLDGSRAANRLGWQWTVGSGTGRPYGFARKQVERRAPGLCKSCELRDRCPIEAYPEDVRPVRLDPPPELKADPDLARTAGPAAVRSDGRTPEAVWLTAESLGDDDPALRAHPRLPAVFVFDEALLARWKLSAKRLVFLAETLADLQGRRPVELLRGDPVVLLAHRKLAATSTPVPGWRRRARSIEPAEVHPWPWLVRPHAGPAGSFSAWRKVTRR